MDHFIFTLDFVILLQLSQFHLVIFAKRASHTILEHPMIAGARNPETMSCFSAVAPAPRIAAAPA